MLKLVTLEVCITIAFIALVVGFFSWCIRDVLLVCG